MKLGPSLCGLRPLSSNPSLVDIKLWEETYASRKDEQEYKVRVVVKQQSKAHTPAGKWKTGVGRKPGLIDAGKSGEEMRRARKKKRKER